MLNQFSRTELLIGKEGIEKLQNAKVAIFGIGGVGSFVVEGLARAGIGNFILIDDDKVCLTNLNRQIIATRKTIGKNKVEVARDRILEINPNANVEIHQEFFMPDSDEILDNTVDYIVDSVDTVTAKVELVVRANRLNIPIMSCMGTGNKLDPTKFEVTDIYKTSVCPLAKVMRKELRTCNLLVDPLAHLVLLNSHTLRSISTVPNHNTNCSGFVCHCRNHAHACYCHCCCKSYCS